MAVGGCAYCNNNSFRSPAAIKTIPIRDQVRDGVEYVRKRFDAKKFIVYFQPFSNTYAETGYLRELYADALAHPDVVGLAIGTRPDCVDRGKIGMIADFARQTFVSLEFGVESIYDETLRRVNRGHDYNATRNAIEMARGRGIHIGAHLILGFPWETHDQWLAMADEMSRVGIDATAKSIISILCEGRRWPQSTRDNHFAFWNTKSIWIYCATSSSGSIRGLLSSGYGGKRRMDCLLPRNGAAIRTTSFGIFTGNSIRGTSIKAPGFLSIIAVLQEPVYNPPDSNKLGYEHSRDIGIQVMRTSNGKAMLLWSCVAHVP